MNEAPIRVGFSSRKVHYTKDQLESLAQWKKDNRGSVYGAVVCAKSDRRFDDMDTLDLVQFAESCEKRLESWERDMEHYYEFIRPA